MGSTPSPALANLPSAFAAACRVSRSDTELFERCRDVAVDREERKGKTPSDHAPVIATLG